MSDFLAAERIPTFSGYRAEHITRDLDLVVVGNAISRGNPELEEVLDRKIRYCSLPEAIREHFLWGARSIVIAGTHGKTTTTSLTGWLLTHGGVDPSVLVGGIARNLGERRIELPAGPGARLRDRRRRVRQRLLRQDRQVPEVPARHRRHQQRRVRSRRHLRRHRRRDARVPAAGQPGAAANGLLLLGADSPVALALEAGRACRESRRSGHRGRPTGRRTTSSRRVRRPRFRVRRQRLARSANSKCRCSARTTCATRWRRSPSRLEVGISAERIGDGLRAFAGVKRRLEVVGTADGVTVYDDFAHHPTAVAETLAGLRAAQSEARIWAVFEPRSASSCRRVFQDDFARAFAGADEIVARAGVPIDAPGR